jgi:hypothetical protein
MSAGAPETPRERKLGAAIRSLTERVGTEDAERYATHVHGLTCFQRGRWQEARSVLLREIDSLPYGHPGMVFARIYAVFTDYHLGDLRRSFDRCSKLLAQADDLGDVYTSVNLGSTAVASALLAADDPSGARTAVHAALARWPQTSFSVQHWHKMLYDGNIDLYEGRGAAGYARFTADWARLKKSLLLHGSAVRIPAYYLRAALAVASVTPGAIEAPARAAEARTYAALLAKENDAWAGALAALAEAAAANLLGDRDGAASHLRAAVARAEETSTGSYLTPARHALGRLLGDGKMVEDVERELGAQGVRNPARWVAVHVPGEWSLGQSSGH